MSLTKESMRKKNRISYLERLIISRKDDSFFEKVKN
jgi:hypothetical protein